MIQKEERTVAKQQTEQAVRIYPHPDLAARGENLPGVGIDGRLVPDEVSEELAAEWLDNGLATLEPPQPQEDPAGEPGAKE